MSADMDGSSSVSDPSLSSTEGYLPEEVGKVVISSKDSTATAFVLPGGRVGVRLSEKAHRLAQHLQKRADQRIQIPFPEKVTRHCKKEYQTNFRFDEFAATPRLNIAMHIVGSRGDVQPFVAIGKILSKPPYSHRVRICTHAVFKDFVEENGLEFFCIGGDPAVLMAYMARNSGFLPGRASWKAGDVSKRRADIAEILEGCWRGCIEPGNGMGGEWKGADRKTSTDRFFVADAIIANPPSYAHIHCAEKLGIPLHMLFTMPWSPTQYFPHPLASIEKSNCDPNLANYLSFSLMELLAWQGLGDIINGFRMKTLHMDPISPLWGHTLLSRMKVPFTYAWSSALIPKPPDWGSHIDISGFAFLQAPSSYQPPKDLVAFLEAGPPPVYIGFGSIVVDKPKELTSMIFGAIKRAGVRALVSKGWGGLGGEEPPEGVFLLGNCPHDWLFQHVSCVVHHGGAGTTAIGIAMGKPTVVVPFFGDQPFWGSMIYRAGAGPEPVPYKSLTEEILAESITRALGSDIKSAVKEMSEKIAGENGAADAAASFHQAINMDHMRCLLSPENVAVWRVKKTALRLSGVAAGTLIAHGELSLDQLKLIHHKDWYIDEGALSPILGVIAAVSGTMTNAIINIIDYSKIMSKTLHKPAEQNPSNGAIPEIEPELTLEDLERISSQISVQAGVVYPPEDLETVAQWMASNTLPNPWNRSKPRKSYSWPAVRDTKTMDKRKAKKAQHHEHGRLHEAATETSHFATSFVGTALKAPVSFFYNLANGFHNAPSFMFPNETVRRRESITGVGSGIRVAVLGFTFNIFDGVTGVVTQTYHGAQKEGVAGFGKGVGKGLYGLLSQSLAAVFGVPGYTLKGIEKQIAKRYDRDLKAKILEVRLRQGLAAYRRASAEDKRLILSRWKELGCKV